MSTLEDRLGSYFGVNKDSDIDIIRSLFHKVEVNKGDILLNRGQYCKDLFYVESGYLRFYVETEHKSVTQWITSPGNFATDLCSLLFDCSSRWNIEALTNGELYCMSKSDYKSLGERIPQWYELEKLFIAKCFTVLEDRIFSHLSMSAEERYHHFFESNKELFSQVPLQYLASMLGMTAETFSRIRSKRI